MGTVDESRQLKPDRKVKQQKRATTITPGNVKILFNVQSGQNLPARKKHPDEANDKPVPVNKIDSCKE